MGPRLTFTWQAAWLIPWNYCLRPLIESTRAEIACLWILGKTRRRLHTRAVCSLHDSEGSLIYFIPYSGSPSPETGFARTLWYLPWTSGNFARTLWYLPWTSGNFSIPQRRPLFKVRTVASSHMSFMSRTRAFVKIVTRSRQYIRGSWTGSPPGLHTWIFEIFAPKSSYVHL